MFCKKHERIRIAQTNKIINLIVIFLIIGVIIFTITNKYLSKIRDANYQPEYKHLLSLYSQKLYNESILYSNDMLDKYNECGKYSGLILKIRASSYFKLNQYELALSDFNEITGFKTSDYYLLYHRALLNDILNTQDTAQICSDLTEAINIKGGMLTSKKLDVNYMDSTNIWDVNYIEMLQLRIKYCEKVYPERMELDKELIKSEAP